LFLLSAVHEQWITIYSVQNPCRRTLVLAVALLLVGLATGFMISVNHSATIHDVFFESSAGPRELPLDRKIDLLFQCFVEGWSPNDDDLPYVASGWMMELPTGKEIQRCELQRWARPLIDLGPKAVPHLVKWVRYHNCAVRYVAIYALREITHQDPMIYHFAHGDEDSCTESAIEVWLEWWTTNQSP
jgi:hypothetical protein